MNGSRRNDESVYRVKRIAHYERKGQAFAVC